MMIGALINVLAIAGGMQAGQTLQIDPLPPPPAGHYGLIGFRISAPWMRGSIHLRMPETLQSSAGLHFIDHDRADMRPLHPVEKYPEWSRDSRSKALRYTLTLKEGVVMSGEAVPEREAVRLAFTVRNTRPDALEGVSCQMCLVLAESEALGKRNDLAPVHAWWDGAFRSFAQTTPTPAEVGRAPWVLMLTQDGKDRWPGPRSYPDGWWIVDQVASSELIARVTDDGKHLVAITWQAPPVFLMTNTRIPCVHAGPTEAVSIATGGSHTWRGIIWALPNDSELLRRRFAAFRRAAARVGGDAQ